MASYSQQLSRLAALFGGNQSSYGLALSNRNYIVDGNIDSFINASQAVAANGSSNAVATMYYGIAGATNGGTLSVVAAGWTLGSEPVGMASPAGNVLSWVQASAATTTPQISQRLENALTLQGRSSTFSCWLWCASGTQTITNIQTLQNFGSGGSPSSNVIVNVPVNWVLTTTPQRFSVRIDWPSIAGKTLGTTVGTHYIQVYVQYPANTTYTINTAQWQLEQSSPNAPAIGMPTAFEYRGVQAELARVQRYYQVYPNAPLCAGNNTAGGTVYNDLILPTPMRAAPGAVASGTFSYNNASGYSVQVPGPSTIRLTVTIGSTGYGFGYNGAVTLDARL